MPVSLDIILPCFNPNDTWPSELIGFFTSAKEKYNISFLLVNDGSLGDKVNEQISGLQHKNIPIRHISYKKNMGKGYALRQGVASSQGDFIVYTDIDFPFTNQSMHDIIDVLTIDHCDVVAGYRDGNYYQKKMSGFRRALSKAFRSFIGNWLKMPVTDTQCGLKGFNKKGREKFLATRINRYLFDFEFIYTSCKDHSITVKTVKVNLKDDVIFSRMRFKILVQEMFNLLYILIFLKPNKGNY